jgi:hypothetical protein
MATYLAVEDQSRSITGEKEERGRSDISGSKIMPHRKNKRVW